MGRWNKSFYNDQPPATQVELGVSGHSALCPSSQLWTPGDNLLSKTKPLSRSAPLRCSFLKLLSLCFPWVLLPLLQRMPPPAFHLVSPWSQAARAHTQWENRKDVEHA